MAQRSATVTVKRNQIVGVMRREGARQWSCKQDQLYAWWAGRLRIPASTVSDIMEKNGYKVVQADTGKNADKFGYVRA